MYFLEIKLIFNYKSGCFLWKDNFDSTSKFLNFNDFFDKTERNFCSSLRIETQELVNEISLSLVGFELFLIIINFGLIDAKDTIDSNS